MKDRKIFTPNKKREVWSNSPSRKQSSSSKQLQRSVFGRRTDKMILMLGAGVVFSGLVGGMQSGLNLLLLVVCFLFLLFGAFLKWKPTIFERFLNRDLQFWAIKLGNRPSIRRNWLLQRLHQFFLTRLQRAVFKQVSMTSVDEMTGRDFELLCSRLYSKLGYGVVLTKQSRDQGADLVLTDQIGRIVIQLKRQSTPVGNWAIQEVCGAMGMYRAHRGMVVTNSSFTAQAKELALANRVELVDRAEFSFLLHRAELLESQ